MTKFNNIFKLLKNKFITLYNSFKYLFKNIYIHLHKLPIVKLNKHGILTSYT